MKIYKDPKFVAEKILCGNVFVIQVDTVFGLVCRGDDEKLMKKVENIKHRDHLSFGFFVRDINVAKKYVKINDKQGECFYKCFPGFFTLIFEATDYALKTIPTNGFGEKEVYDCNTKNKKIIKTLGLRVPKSSFCIEMMRYIDIPLLATSANISKQKTATSFDEIDKTILNSVYGCYYDKSIDIAGKSSTIIDLYDVNKPNIIRSGSGDVNILKNIIKI